MVRRGQTPRFVVLDGLDGAGTTTHCRLLAEALRGRELQVCLTAEPSGGPVGRLLRAHLRGDESLDPVTAALAFSADRADHLTRIVRPALQAGKWVVCDRYLLSTLAYQGAGGVDQRWILSLSSGFAVPDVTVLLDAPEDVRAGRVASRALGERYDEPDVQARVRRAYDEGLALLRDRGDAVALVSSAGPVDRTAAGVLDAVLGLDATRPDG